MTEERLPKLKGLRHRVAELEEAIRTHRDARGDDRCWLDDIELYKILGENEVPEAMQLALPDREAFLGRCEAYFKHRQKPGCPPWKTVEELTGLLRRAALLLDQDGSEGDDETWDLLQDIYGALGESVEGDDEEAV